ncbi:hypothetical protein ABK040_005901 [Willaertia magna]
MKLYCILLLIILFVIYFIGAVSPLNNILDRDLSFQVDTKETIIVGLNTNYGRLCNSTLDCGSGLLCTNRTCTGCSSDNQCDGNPFVTCQTASIAVNVTEGLNFNSTFLNIGICKNKQLIPISLWDIFSTVVASVGGTLASASGLGGGPLYVPILLLLGRYPATVATALSSSMIFGSSSAIYLILSFQKHPEANRPIINYDAVAVTEPIILAGAAVGVFLNILFPGWLVNLCLLLSLLAIGARSFYKGAIQFKKERKLIKSKVGKEDVEMKENTTASHHDDKSDVHEISTETSEHESTAEKSLKELSSMPHELHSEEHLEETKVGISNSTESIEKVVESDKGKLLKWILKLESLRLPPHTFLVLAIAWVVVFLSSLFKGGRTFRSPVGIDKCTPLYWVDVVTPLPILIIISLIVALYLRFLHFKKNQVNYKFLEGDVQWTTKNSLIIPSTFFLAGFIAGFLGIGGGMVAGPLFIEMGMLIPVSTATSSFIVFFTASSTTAQYLIMGTVSWDYFLWFYGFGLVSGIIGQLMVTFLMKKFNRPSVIVFIIGVCIVIAALLTLAVGIVNFVSDFKAGKNLGFNNVCG